MTIPRRQFFVVAGAAISAPRAFLSAQAAKTASVATMYGLIGKMTAVPGQRDAVVSILLGSTQAMPGCLSYVIATDPVDGDALWITEVWDSTESHKASLTLPAVQAAIAKAKPLIAGFSNRVETVPIGGYGLGKTAAR